MLRAGRVSMRFRLMTVGKELTMQRERVAACYQRAQDEASVNGMGR